MWSHVDYGRLTDEIQNNSSTNESYQDAYKIEWTKKFYLLLCNTMLLKVNLHSGVHAITIIMLHFCLVYLLKSEDVGDMSPLSFVLQQTKLQKFFIWAPIFMVCYRDRFTITMTLLEKAGLRSMQAIVMRILDSNTGITSWKWLRNKTQRERITIRTLEEIKISVV